MQSGGTINNNAGMTFSGVGSGLNVTGTTTNNSAGSIFFDGGSSSTLTGNVNNSGIFETGFFGGNNKVTVTGTFTNNAGAALQLNATGDAVSVNILNNAGKLAMVNGTTLTILGGGTGVTDVAALTSYLIGGTFQVKNGATLTNAYADVTTVEGTIELENGQTSTVTPSGGTLTISNGGQFLLARDIATPTKLTLSGSLNNNGGRFEVNNGSTVTITGSVTNAGTFETGFTGGNNTVNISGTFANNAGGTLLLSQSKDIVNVPTLTNAGTVTVASSTADGTAALNITGAGTTFTNSGTVNLTSGTLKFSASAISLTGGGTLNLGNSNGTQTYAFDVGTGATGTLTNVTNTITT